VRSLHHEDKLWLLIWLSGLTTLAVWCSLFLNRPAFLLLSEACGNTLFACLLVVAGALVLGWFTGVSLFFLETRWPVLYLGLTFILNLIRSIPQIIGVLCGYVILTVLIGLEVLQSQLSQLIWMAFVITVFVFLEIVDLVRERIAYYEKLDFVPAMLCCGIPESRIINREILWKNSRAHILHKLVSLFGTAIFLQCSIDFIVSVGLSTDVSLSNFPVTLGSMLAKLDSKQDILAISSVLSGTMPLQSLFFQHLQGITIAGIIVLSLLCLYKISTGLVRRFHL